MKASQSPSIHTKLGTDPKKGWLGVVLLLALSIVLSLFLHLNWDQAQLILTELRLPRVVTSIAVGGILGLSGVILQTLLANPLSEPYTLGIASGAALGAAVTTSLKGMINVLGLNLGAIVGAGLVLMVLIAIVKKSSSLGESLILFGVMISFFCSGLLAVWMALADPVGVQSITFWLLGDLSRVEIKTAATLMSMLFIAAIYFYKKALVLDAFLFGPNWVETFGVNRNHELRQGVFIVSIIIGAAVSAVGMIGFVGLVIPHFSRMAVGSRHRALIPFSVILGSASLTASDTLARTLSYPHELPVGAITSVLGAPILMYLLMNRKRGWS
jgi:iron complex transport system permease protein